MAHFGSKKDFDIYNRDRKESIRKKITKEKKSGKRPGPVWRTVEKNVPFCPMCWKKGVKNEMKRCKGDAATMFTWECTGIRCFYVC